MSHVLMSVTPYSTQFGQTLPLLQPALPRAYTFLFACMHTHVCVFNLKKQHARRVLLLTSRCYITLPPDVRA